MLLRTLLFAALLCGVAGSDAAAAVKVFVLAGQSNMAGHGQIAANPKANQGKGSLEWLVKTSPDRAKYKHLRNGEEWTTRSDVQIWHLGRTGNLQPGYGGSEAFIGPELGFGHVVGDALKEPVLLIKAAWGGKSLGKDFRPPSSGGETGPYYTQLVAIVKTVMKDAARLFPQYAGQKLELAGIGWHQGWNDRVNQAFNDAYETNMANFIRDIRKELDSPNLPFVIGETGMSGFEEKHPRAVSLMKAQAAVAKHEEFKGNVAFTPTRAYYRPREDSPSGQAYHWNNNAETHYLIGQGMAGSMLKLMGGQDASE